MARVVRLGPEPTPAEVADLGDIVYHADILHPSHAALRLAGIEVRPVDEHLPEDAVFILPLGASRSGPLYDLVQLLNRLLGPGGCPWDQAQTHETLKQCLVEETYEVLEAIDSGDQEKLVEELGDLLLQPVMHAQIAAHAGRFTTDDIANGIVEKLIRRHPHVFGSVEAKDSETVLTNWQKIKQLEKGGVPTSALGDVPKAMPALLRALIISKRAAKSGFEWPNIDAVWEKVSEEQAELREAVKQGSAADVESEVGDLLFTVVNLARWYQVDPEDALRKMLNRFSTRFYRMEARSDQPLSELSPEAWDELWTQAKREVG